MARIRFNEGESIIGIVIAVALAIAIVLAAIVFGWAHHDRKNNGNVGATPSSELRVPIVRSSVLQA